MTTLEPHHLRELHSLSRYPPIALDDDAARDLERAGLVTRLRPSIPGRQTSRWALAEPGKLALHQTALLCAVAHCPCHGGAPTSDAVQRVVDAQLARFLSPS